jgi:hypothetical protein
MGENRLPVDYFFHKDDYQGDWDKLVVEVLKPRAQVWVEFESIDTPKGLRATKVTQINSVT